jgi:hypothetical protein
MASCRCPDGTPLDFLPKIEKTTPRARPTTRTVSSTSLTVKLRLCYRIVTRNFQSDDDASINHLRSIHPDGPKEI